MRVNKQLDALVTTIIFCNLLFLVLGLLKLNVLYWNLGVNLFLLMFYKLISKYRMYINGILETRSFFKKLNEGLK
jgi:predicted membrane protein